MFYKILLPCYLQQSEQKKKKPKKNTRKFTLLARSVLEKEDAIVKKINSIKEMTALNLNKVKGVPSQHDTIQLSLQLVKTKGVFQLLESNWIIAQLLMWFKQAKRALPKPTAKLASVIHMVLALE